MFTRAPRLPISAPSARLPRKEISDTAIYEAARLAAYHSKARNSSQVPVDCTLVRYVSKPNGSKPGMVIYVNNKTLYVKPSQTVEKQ